MGTNGRIITDLDSLFSGKLRDVANEDERVIKWLEKQKDRQADFYSTIFSTKEMSQEITLSKLIFRLERYLIKISQELNNYFETNSIPPKMQPLIEKLTQLREKHENAESVDTYKTVLLQGINNVSDEIEKCLSPEIAETIPLIKNLAAFILAATEAARIYILPKGCIEHYYTRSSIQYMPVSAKDRLFRNELEFIQDAHRKTVRKNYSGLIEILEKAAGRN